MPKFTVDYTISEMAATAWIKEDGQPTREVNAITVSRLMSQTEEHIRRRLDVQRLKLAANDEVVIELPDDRTLSVLVRYPEANAPAYTVQLQFDGPGRMICSTADARPALPVAAPHILFASRIDVELEPAAEPPPSASR